MNPSSKPMKPVKQVNQIKWIWIDRKRVCSGRLGLTELRLPLMWKDTDYFKNRGDYRRFAVFCLAKVGTEGVDTSLVTPVDRSSTDITFPDAIVL